MSRLAHRSLAPISWSACCPSSPSSLWLCPPPIWPSTSPSPAKYTLYKASTFGVSGPDYHDACVHTMCSSHIDGRSPLLHSHQYWESSLIHRQIVHFSRYESLAVATNLASILSYLLDQALRSTVKSVSSYFLLDFCSTLVLMRLLDILFRKV